MKHLCSRWLLLALLLILPGLQAGAAPNEKLRLAVLPFTTTKAADEASAITEELRQAFVNSGRYVVIDRTLTGSILKEWETQQSGMTESDRAIKIGKLFNVQVIVSGKLTEFTSGGWHLSAVMLDSQTGVTMRARTIRHRGDFFSLLDGKLPRLALEMTRGATSQPKPTGASPRTTAKTSPSLGTPANISRPAVGNGLRLAVFPGIISSPFAASVGLSPKKISGKINHAILKGAGQDASIVFSYADKPLPEQDAIREYSWEGFFVQEPRLGYVTKESNSLGVHAVLMYRFYETGQYSSEAQFTLFLIDVKNVIAKQYSATGGAYIYTGPVELLKEVSETAGRLFEKYRKDAYRRNR